MECCCHTPEPLYNRVYYNTVLDIIWIRVGMQMTIYRVKLIFLYHYAFYTLCNTVFIANKEINLDPNNSVIKRFWSI